MNNLPPGTTEEDIDRLIEDKDPEYESYRDDAADAGYEESVEREEFGDD